MSLVQPIELLAGDDTELDLALTEEDGITPLDLTGKQVNWALANAYDLSDILVSKTSAPGGGITIDDTIGGLATVVINGGDDTASLGGQPYYHEAEVVSFETSTTTSVTVITGPAVINKTALH